MKGTQRKNVFFEDRDQKGEELEHNLGQESLSGEKDLEENRRVDRQGPGQESVSGESGESGVEEIVHSEEQNLEDKILSGEFRWMRSGAHKTDPKEETCSVADCSVDDNSRISGIDTYSDRNSSTGSELSELAIHM